MTRQGREPRLVTFSGTLAMLIQPTGLDPAIAALNTSPPASPEQTDWTQSALLLTSVRSCTAVGAVCTSTYYVSSHVCRRACKAVALCPPRSP